MTPIPNKGEPLVAMPFSKVSEFLGKTFFWARTIKVPYLSVEEAKHFADYLNKYLEEQRKINIATIDLVKYICPNY